MQCAFDSWNLKSVPSMHDAVRQCYEKGPAIFLLHLWSRCLKYTRHSDDVHGHDGNDESRPRILANVSERAVQQQVSCVHGEQKSRCTSRAEVRCSLV